MLVKSHWCQSDSCAPGSLWGRKPWRPAGPGDSAVSGAAAPVPSASSGLFLADGCAVVGLAGALGPGRGGAALSPGSPAKATRSRASRVTILSPWAPVSLGSGRVRAALLEPNRVGRRCSREVWVGLRRDL